jgi:hypothetical protein
VPSSHLLAPVDTINLPLKAVAEYIQVMISLNVNPVNLKNFGKAG